MQIVNKKIGKEKIIVGIFWNKNSSKIAIVFEIILIIISVGYFIYSLIFIKDSQLFNIINSFLLVFFAVMLLLN